MVAWFVTTLRNYPEIATFLALAVGYYVGGKSFRGFSLGAATATRRTSKFSLASQVCT